MNKEQAQQELDRMGSELSWDLDTEISGLVTLCEDNIDKIAAQLVVRLRFNQMWHKEKLDE